MVVSRRRMLSAVGLVSQFVITNIFQRCTYRSSQNYPQLPYSFERNIYANLYIFQSTIYVACVVVDNTGSLYIIFHQLYHQFVTTFTCFAAVQTIDSTLAVLLPIGASISLICMFLMFDSLQTMFAICTAGKLLYNEHFVEYIFSNCNGCIGISLTATVSICVANVRYQRWSMDLICVFRSVQSRRITLVRSFIYARVSMAAHRSLDSNGRYVRMSINITPFFFYSTRYGNVCGIYCVGTSTKSQGLDSIAIGIATLRRILGSFQFLHQKINIFCTGLLLVVHFQCKCNGTSCDASRRQSDRCICKTTTNNGRAQC